MSLAQIVSNQSRAILVIVGLLCAAGFYAAWQLPVAILPQTDFPRIVIIADNGEAPASQTLVSVTRPIEEAMNGVPGIARIKSKTARGSSEISLDRKSTRLNSSHTVISYAVFCLKKKKNKIRIEREKRKKDWATGPRE